MLSQSLNRVRSKKLSTKEIKVTQTRPYVHTEKVRITNAIKSYRKKITKVIFEKIKTTLCTNTQNGGSISPKCLLGIEGMRESFLGAVLGPQKLDDP